MTIASCLVLTISVLGTVMGSSASEKGKGLRVTQPPWKHASLGSGAAKPLQPVLGHVYNVSSEAEI